MRIEFTGPQTELERLLGGYYNINAIGPIEKGDSERFDQLFESISPPPFTTIYISSGGGDVREAMRIGRSIRERALRTAVGSYILDPDENVDQHIVRRKLIPGKCLSAATLIYLGGRFRFLDVNSRFGVHQFKFDKEDKDNIYHAQILSAEISTYLRLMNIDSLFLEKTAEVPSSQLQDLDHKFLRDMGVVTDAFLSPKWSVEARDGLIYVKGERDTVFGYQKLLLVKAGPGYFHFHAIFDHQGRADEIKSMALSEITYNGEDSVIDVSSRVLKEEMNGLLNAIVRISRDEATMLARSESFGIRFRHSKEAELFLGVSSIPTEGGKNQLETIARFAE